LPRSIDDLDEQIADKLVARTADLLAEAKTYRKRLAAQRRRCDRELRATARKAFRTSREMRSATPHDPRFYGQCAEAEYR
jgi:hypothetical protein